MNGGENNEDYIKYKNETYEKLNKTFNEYINKIISLKVETKDIIYENLFNKEIIIEQQNRELLKKIKYVKGLINLFNFNDFDEIAKLNILPKKRKMDFNNINEDEDDEEIKIIDINNENENNFQKKSKSISLNYNEPALNNDKSIGSNKTIDDQENIETKGIEISTDLVPTIQKIRNFTKTRMPVMYTRNSVKMTKYFNIKSQLEKNPNLDFSLTCSDIDDKPTEPSMLSTPSEIHNLTEVVLKELKFNYPKIELYLKTTNNSSIYDFIKTKTLLYSLIDYQSKNPQYYYYYLCKNKEMHKILEYKYLKLSMVRKFGGKIQNILKSAEKKFKNYIIRKDSEGNTMIKGELSVKYEALINYFLSGGKSVEEISYIQFEIFLYKSDLFKDVQSTTDTINIPEEMRKNLEIFQNNLETLRANI